MFAMSVHLAFTVKMIPRADATTRVATRESEPVFNENPGAPYVGTRVPFYSPLTLPCQQPPCGSAAGVDLTTGQTVPARKRAGSLWAALSAF